MERGNLQHLLFALGRTLQDLYIAEKGGGKGESAELQRRVKESLQILRFMGIGLEAEMIFNIEADEGREHLFAVGVDWTGSQDENDEPDYMIGLKVGIVLLRSDGREVAKRGDVEVAIVSDPELGGDDFDGLPPEKNRLLPMPNEPLTDADWKFLWELGVVAPQGKQGEEVLNPCVIKDAAISLALNLQSCYLEEKFGERRKAAVLRKHASDIVDFLHSHGSHVSITVQNIYPREDGCQNKLEIESFWPPEKDAEVKFYLCLDVGFVISAGGKKIMPGNVSAILHSAYAKNCAGESGEDAEDGTKDGARRSKLLSSEESRKLFRSIFGSDPPPESWNSSL